MSKKIALKEGEIVVSQNEFGWLAEEFIRGALRGNRYEMKWLDETIRRWWPKLEGYYQRHIISAIEVAIALDEPPRYNREPLEHKEVWKRIVADLRGPKHPFTIDYHCHKCKAKGLKLWRGVHNCGDDEGHDLLCAACLAPDIKVSDKGLAHIKDDGVYERDTDQIKGWLPAIPVDDTYWGYSSVPSQDVEWWVALPTYPPK